MSAELIEKRDTKTKPHLKQFAPVWLTEEKIIEEDEVIKFEVIFCHNTYGWVTRYYRYDGFDDVLYHRGQTSLDEDRILNIQAEEPFINVTLTDISNAYGG